MFTCAWDRPRRSVESDQVRANQRDRSGLSQPPAEEFQGWRHVRRSRYRNTPHVFEDHGLVEVLSARNMRCGQSDAGFGDHGYVTSQSHASFVFTCTCSGSVSGVQSCDVVMYAVPEMSIVHAPLDEALLRPPGFACSTRCS